MRVIELMCLFDNWNKFLVISDDDFCIKVKQNHKLNGMLIIMGISIITAITEKGAKSFPKRSRHLIDRKDLTI